MEKNFKSWEGIQRLQEALLNATTEDELDAIAKAFKNAEDADVGVVEQ